MSNINETLAARGQRYGDFKNHARISRQIKNVLMEQEGWSALSPSQCEALDMIAHKIARILNGDPNYADSWHDIAGYAVLVEQELNEETPTAPQPAAPSQVAVSPPTPTAPEYVPSTPSKVAETPRIADNIVVPISGGIKIAGNGVPSLGTALAGK